MGQQQAAMGGFGALGPRNGVLLQARVLRHRDIALQEAGAHSQERAGCPQTRGLLCSAMACSLKQADHGPVVCHSG